ncbi:MAG TPA: hypothetical protein VE988_28900 [Gemmataceae bacterium]|nr:hypothetical protein [Gemmataceae bacterium]
MNGFIKRTMSIVCLGGAAAVSGCCKDDCRLCDYYDNCRIERYGSLARDSVMHTVGAQVNNGHVLDQTVFTYHFEAGTDKLTKGGLEHLAYLARRRPQPDPIIYLQTASTQDVAYDPAAPIDQFSKERAELDGKRIQAVQRFLNADTAGRAASFTVVLHDAPTPGLPATSIGIANQRLNNNFQGSLGGGMVGGAAGAGGAAGGSSGGSGTPR